jgi:hypothetical protein
MVKQRNEHKQSQIGSNASFISARRIMDTFIFVTYVIPNNQGSCPMNEVIIIITEPIKYFQNLFSECTPVL